MRGDEAEIYRTLSPRVLALVRSQVTTSAENVEDACHFAWAAFLRRSDEVEHAAALSWVATTAVHEAYKLIRKQQRAVSLDQALESEAVPPTLHAAAPAERAEQRERLDLVRRLPDRQRRIVLLQAAGLSHEEIARATGDTRRTVERQLYRARNTLAGLERADPAAQRRAALRPIPSRGSTAPLHRL
jgi:RNA polymerase sigma factor (sigma-70 family)